MATKKTPPKDSVFTPIKRKDRLTHVRVYARTADPFDKRAIVVAQYQRSNRDLARVAASSYGTETTYYKIGDAPFSVHFDCEGALMIRAEDPHFRMLMTLGIRNIRLTAMDTSHGSEKSKSMGIASQYMSVDAGKLHGIGYYRYEFMHEWFETMDGRHGFGSTSRVFDTSSAVRFNDSPLVWVGGIDGDEFLVTLVREQETARAEIAARKEHYENAARERARAATEKVSAE